jgi:hypothetical protein
MLTKAYAYFRRLFIGKPSRSDIISALDRSGLGPVAENDPRPCRWCTVGSGELYERVADALRNQLGVVLRPASLDDLPENFTWKRLIDTIYAAL